MIRRARRIPARTGLTLWYMLLLTVSMLALGGAGLWSIQRVLYTSADELLMTRAAAVMTEIDYERGRLNVELASEPDQPPSALTAGLDIVRVWDRNRRTRFRQETVQELPDPASETLAAILSERDIATFRTISKPSGEFIRSYIAPIRDDGRIVGVLEVGRSLGDIEAVLAQLRWLGAAGLVVVLLIGWFGGSFLAARALAPVDRITRAASEIGADDLSRRLNLMLPDDELGRLSAAFDGMIDRLDRAFRRQRQFTADASHELRTPLAIIRSQAEVALGRQREPAYYSRVLDSICEETERLERLTENLLLLARVDDGPDDLIPRFELLDLEDLALDLGSRMATRAHERGVVLDMDINPVGPIHGQADWMSQLLLNLLDNAVRYTPAGGRVTLALTTEGGQAVVRVADTGIGIAPEHLSRIFERFYRVDQARSRASGGAGLGLAICARVTRLHGGHLDVTSTLGEGATFTVRLPLASWPAPTPDALGALPATV